MKFDRRTGRARPASHLRKGAVAPWAQSPSPYYTQTLKSLARHYEFSLDTPFEELPEKARQEILFYGSGDDPIHFIR